MTDPLDEFLEFDASMGADVTKCPHCGAAVSSGLFFDDEAECPDCGILSLSKLVRITHDSPLNSEIGF